MPVKPCAWTVWIACAYIYAHVGTLDYMGVSVIIVGPADDVAGLELPVIRDFDRVKPLTGHMGTVAHAVDGLTCVGQIYVHSSPIACVGKAHAVSAAVLVLLWVSDLVSDLIKQRVYAGGKLLKNKPVLAGVDLGSGTVKTPDLANASAHAETQALKYGAKR